MATRLGYPDPCPPDVLPYAPVSLQNRSHVPDDGNPSVHGRGHADVPPVELCACRVVDDGVEEKGRRLNLRHDIISGARGEIKVSSSQSANMMV